MTSTTEAPATGATSITINGTVISVGDGIRSQQIYRGLPVGSRIRGMHLHEKRADGVWHNLSRGGERTITNPNEDGSIILVSLPSSTSIQVGDVLEVLEDFSRLPIGATFGVEDRSGQRFRKVGGNLYHRLNGEGNPMAGGSYSATAFTMGVNRVFTLPGPSLASWMQIGYYIRSNGELAELPDGTVIGPGEAEQWRKVGDSWECIVHSRTPSVVGQVNDHLSIYEHNKILSLPVSMGETRIMTLQQFKWKFRDGSLRAATENGIAIDPVHEVLKELGCEMSDFQIGKGVRVSNGVDLDTLPEGTVGYSRSPGHRYFGVYRKGSRAWECVLGNNAGMESSGVMIQSGAEPAWVTQNGTEEDTEAISVFKARAWVVGSAAKVRNSWCSAFENAMDRLGINESSVMALRYMGMAIGDTVDRSSASRLPHGSILSWHEGENFTYFIRDDARDTISKTRYLFGTVQSNHNGQMKVEHIEGEGFPDLKLSVQNTAEFFAAVPVGSVINNGGSLFVIAEDRRAATIGRMDAPVPATGRYSYNDFSLHAPLVWVRFGGQV